MGRIRLRTKFLLSLLGVSAGLTAATLLIVSYSVKSRVRETIQLDLQNSVNTYASFEKQRDTNLARSAELLANLPNVRALMTTEDLATIQEASADVWRLSGRDLLVLAGRTGKLAALRSTSPDLDRDQVEQLVHKALESGKPRQWWLGGQHLYEAWIQPIYFGAPSESNTFGYLVLGEVIDHQAAVDFSKIASSEVLFSFGDTPVASTLSATQLSSLKAQLPGMAQNLSRPAEVKLGAEHYLETTVKLSTDGEPPVFLSVFRSFDQATLFLSGLNRVLTGLGLFSIFAGSGLVFFLSHAFTRPLAHLVTGVRALQDGDFSYPLESTGQDEITEVTAAFIRMRENLQATQEEQRQLEERLRHSHKMEAVGTLAGGVAHDFNNLLTIIRGNSDLLIDRAGSDTFHRKCVEQIQKAAGRAVALTRQLLAFSRMQVLQPQILELNAIVTEMGKMLPRLIGENIEYKFIAAEHLARVKADPGQIEQVVMNLAVNARDAMPDGGVLTIKTINAVVDQSAARTRQPMVPGRYVLLSVTDTGRGMEEATKARIFEPFFTTKDVGKGTGLGLATVYGIVKQSGGFIWVESAVGSGTTFEIYLPETQSHVGAEPESEPAAIPSGNETVLVVEDEDGVRDLACQFLRIKGYTVLAAAEGSQALEIARQHLGRIDLLLSDMIMPKMSGGELAEKLMVIRPEISVAFMSGYSKFSRGDSARGFPEAPVLQKPFSPYSLVALVREALAKSADVNREVPNESAV